MKTIILRVSPPDKRLMIMMQTLENRATRLTLRAPSGKGGLLPLRIFLQNPSSMVNKPNVGLVLLCDFLPAEVSLTLISLQQRGRPKLEKRPRKAPPVSSKVSFRLLRWTHSSVCTRAHRCYLRAQRQSKSRQHQRSLRLTASPSTNRACKSHCITRNLQTSRGRQCFLHMPGELSTLPRRFDQEYVYASCYTDLRTQTSLISSPSTHRQTNWMSLLVRLLC